MIGISRRAFVGPWGNNRVRMLLKWCDMRWPHPLRVSRCFKSSESSDLGLHFCVTFVATRISWMVWDGFFIHQNLMIYGWTRPWAGEGNGRQAFGIEKPQIDVANGEAAKLTGKRHFGMPWYFQTKSCWNMWEGWSLKFIQIWHFYGFLCLVEICILWTPFGIFGPSTSRGPGIDWRF